MLDIPQRVTEWAARLGLSSDQTKELVKSIYAVPKPPRDQILNAVISRNESTIRLLADSIAQEVAAPSNLIDDDTPILDVDSLLSIVPELAPTFAAMAYDIEGEEAVSYLRSVLIELSDLKDTPQNFIFDPALEGHLVPALHGILITLLVLGEVPEDSDVEWLGRNRKALAPFFDALYERESVDREFCEQLLQHTPPLAGGTL